MRSLAKWIWLLSVLLIGYSISHHQEDLRQVYSLFQKVTLPSLLVLFCLQAVYTACLAASNHGVYEAIGVQTTFADQMLLILGSGVANRLIPLGGVSGVSSFFYLAGKKGIPVQASLQMTAITTLLGYLQMAPIALLLVGWTGYQVAGNHPAGTAISYPLLLKVAFGILLTVVGVLVFVVLLSRYFWISRIENWKPRLPLLIWFRKSLLLVSQYAVWCFVHYKKLLVPLLYLFTLYPIRILMLFVCFQAFHSSMPLIPMAIGYALSLLVSNLSILPTNLGFFEATLISSFHGFGVPLAIATAVTLLYRSYTFWIPIPFGLFAYAQIRKKRLS